MKVLLSSYECEPNRGSEQGNGWNWAVHLASLGHEVWVLTRAENEASIEGTLEADAINNLHFAYVDVPMRVKPYLKGHLGNFPRYFLWQKECYAVATQLDEAHAFDLVHHVSLGSLQGGSWLYQLRKPFIFGPLGGGQMASKAFKRYFQSGWREEVIRAYTSEALTRFYPHTRRAVGEASLVLATNQETATLAHRLGARRVELFLSTGSPKEYLAPTMPARQPSETFKILWVGRMYPRKGLRLALEALARVDVPFTLTILGGGPQSSLVPGWIEEFGLQEKTNYRGQVPWLEVKEAYLKSDVFLFTSLRESYGAQLLEAMATGLPIITLNHFGARDFVPDTAGIKVSVTIPENVIASLAEAVSYLATHPEARLKMGCAAWEFAKANTWDKRATAMDGLYREVT